MERQCKIGGESAVYEDRISELPEALLLQILSSLQTETVIATSALSKRWRSLWKMVPKLKFDSYHHKSITGSKLWNLRRMEGEDHRFRFTENVYRSLLSHKAPVLESFRLVVRDKYEASDIGIWIGIGMAFSRHVRKLVLDLCYEEEGSVRFPSVLCSCNNTLEVLKLKGSILLDLPFRVCFKSLRELHLYYVEFKDEESVSNLLCGCPSLQDLVVRQNIDMVVETFSISVPSLQRLTIEDEHLIERDGGYVINAPSLKYLNIRGFNGLECCLIENAPELVEAKLTDISDITNEKILESLTSAKRLSLRISPLEMKYPTGIIFYQLLSLELSTYEREWWNLLSHMLDDSPQLQMLKLIGPRQGSDKDCLVDWKRIQPKCVPECLLFHLETFVWTTYDWQREDDKEVATYILKNARRLKKATISTEPIQSKELEKLEKRREMLNELASEVMASNSCHLVFEADTYSYKVGHW